ncbi:hypothetical protein HDU98_009609 [Podochytrium sp. JEL0797]|nr:hypothetical protein HDU98_009609 [Podochytrium sp. JEL0797]
MSSAASNIADTTSDIVRTVETAENIALLVIYGSGLILNSLLLTAAFRVPQLVRNKLGKTIAMLLACFIGTSLVRMAISVLYLGWPGTYYCTTPDCSAMPSQVLGGVQMTFTVFTLVANLFLAIDRHQRVLHSREMQTRTTYCLLLVGAVLSAFFVWIFLRAPPVSPYFPQKPRGYFILLGLTFIPVAVAVVVLHLRLFRHVKRTLRSNALASPTGFVATPNDPEILSAQLLPKDPLEEYALQLSVAMPLCLAVCYIPAFCYSALRQGGVYVQWLDFAASITLALDVILSPILIMYFQRPYLEAFFNLYLCDFL